MIDNQKIFAVLAGLKANQPATQEQIDKLQDELSIALPVDYVDFALVTNGADGAVGGGGYLSLWRIDEIAQFNKDYRVSDFAPGLVLFGSDGGGEAFAFDARDASMAIVQVPFVGMSLSEVQPLAKNFNDFLTLDW
jgi:hypothetical protein